MKEVVRPNFYIVGAEKCGTTALYSYLRQHPQIFMPEVKEPAFFKEKPFYTETQYLDLFKDAGDAVAIGEATPSYLRDPYSAEAIYAFCPSAKIIIMLRNPVDMLYSFYWQNRMTGRETAQSFKESIEIQKTSPEKKPPLVPYYLDLVYAKHVERYFERFGRKNVHVIIFDDFKNDAENVYRLTLRFLGVDDSFVPEFLRVNARKGIRNVWLQQLILRLGLNVRTIRRIKYSALYRRLNRWIHIDAAVSILRSFYYVKQPAPPLDQELRHVLQEDYRDDIMRLSALLECDLSRWYADKA